MTMSAVSSALMTLGECVLMTTCLRIVIAHRFIGINRHALEQRQNGGNARWVDAVFRFFKTQ